MKKVSRLLFVCLFGFSSLVFAEGLSSSSLSQNKYFLGVDFGLAKYHSNFQYTDSNSAAGVSDHDNTETINDKEIGLSFGALKNNYKITGFFTTTISDADYLTNSSFGAKVDYLMPEIDKIRPFIGTGLVYNITKEDLQKEDWAKSNVSKDSLDFSGAGLIFNTGLDFNISKKVFATFAYQVIYNLYGNDSFTGNLGDSSGNSFKRTFKQFGIYGSKVLFSLNYIL